MNSKTASSVILTYIVDDTLTTNLCHYALNQSINGLLYTLTHHNHTIHVHT